MFKFNLPAYIFKEKNYFIAYTPILDLSTAAHSLKQVKDRFEEAVNIFFEETAKRKTLRDALSELDWSKV